MAAKSIGFSLGTEEERQLDDLVAFYSPGNRSEFLRIAMRRMERLRRQMEFAELQEYGQERRVASGLDEVPISEVVHRALAAELG